MRLTKQTTTDRTKGLVAIIKSALIASSLLVSQAVLANPPTSTTVNRSQLESISQAASIERTAAALEVEVALVASAAEGLDFIYGRDYRGARSHFAQMDETYPGLALENLGKLLIFQSLMLENFDFRFETQYQTYSERALAEIEASLAQEGNTKWELFIRGGVLGLEAVHLMRKGEYIASLQRGLDAMSTLERLEEMAPDFVDLKLGDGLYKYWRSAVARKSNLIPDGADQRQEGIQIIREVEQQGVFVGPAATLALAAIRMEEAKPRGALRHIRRFAVSYPSNVINKLLQARMLIRLRRYDQALAALDSVIEIDTDNHRVHTYRATVLLRTGNLEEAHIAIDRYLALPLTDGARAAGLHKKGDVYFRARNFDLAIAQYQAAIDLNNYAPSRRLLTRVQSVQARTQATPESQ
jgi:tetratricopeptide (TPR) repeat protein